MLTLVFAVGFPALTAPIYARRRPALRFLLAGLFIFGGSLWPPMILHAAIDLSSGETGVAAFGEEQDRP